MFHIFKDQLLINYFFKKKKIPCKRHNTEKPLRPNHHIFFSDARKCCLDSDQLHCSDRIPGLPQPGYLYIHILPFNPESQHHHSPAPECLSLPGSLPVSSWGVQNRKEGESLPAVQGCGCVDIEGFSGYKTNGKQNNRRL